MSIHLLASAALMLITTSAGAARFDTLRAGIRQGCHQAAVFTVAKNHHLADHNYAEAASNPKLAKYADEIAHLTELCVLREAARQHLKNQ